MLPSWLRGRTAADWARDATDRWIVLDLETSGLNASVDRILSFGAVAIVGGDTIVVGDAFECVVGHGAATSTAENIAIHGITTAQQRGGVPIAEALSAFDAWRADAPIVGWHIGFDLGFLRAAGYAVPNDAALDIAALATLAFDGKGGDLHDVAARFGIAATARHNAAADAWMTAQVLQALMRQPPMKGSNSFKALHRLAAQSRWL